MREKYLLGATIDKELVFGEFEVRTWNGKNTFSASFNLVKPFNGTDYDLEEYYENWIEDMPKAELYDLCLYHDCKPSELAENLANECYDVRDALDCSLYSEEYEVNGNYWYFESSSCGQHDTREEMEEIINPKAYNLLHELWDKYHLKEVDSEVISIVENLKAMLSKVNEEEWIVDYIERNEENF